MIKGLTVLLDGSTQVEEWVIKNIMKIQKDNCKFSAWHRHIQSGDTRLGSCSGKKDPWFPVDSNPAVCLGNDMLDSIDRRIDSPLRSKYTRRYLFLFSTH